MKKIYTELRSICHEFIRLDCFNLAAALSFFAILSIIPTLLIVVSLLGHYLGESELVLPKISSLLESVLPAFKDSILSNIDTVIDNKKTFGWFGILLLLSVAHFLFANLEKIMNRILHSRTKRHFLVTRLLFLVWLSGITILLLVPSLIQWFQSWIHHWGLAINLGFALSGNLWFFLSSWLSFLMIVLLIPNYKSKFKNVFLGGGIFAILLQLAQWFFGLYIHYSINRYNLIYGSLTLLILGALWLFYFSNIFLLCVVWVARQEGKVARHE